MVEELQSYNEIENIKVDIPEAMPIYNKATSLRDYEPEIK